MCATYPAPGRVESANPAFETLLVHLAVESHGLSQRGMLRLFCGTAGKHFGASDACCASYSIGDGWIIAETEGRKIWGRQGDALPPATSKLVDLALRSGKAVFCHAIPNEVLCHQGDSEHSEL